ncbi:hypothetical protein LTR85_008448 [Meristemomyces frigidus]|nr:hypothetical protein LTR85_008448 [Meristemomyces frigidus]
MVNKIELRVHAGAPSRRTDDERYRAQAEAYLNFTGCVIRSADVPGDGVDTTAEEVTRRNGPATDHGSEVDVEDTQLDMRHGRGIDDSTTILGHDATTFVDDTQLAYTALESQIFTASLTIPDVTPARKRRSTDADDTSPWPEDLDRHSPNEEVRELGSHQDETRPLSSPLLEKASLSVTHNAPVLHGLGKKRKLDRAPVFKPFKLPLKRSVSEVTKARAPITKDGGVSQQRQALSQADSMSSYLKTPILDRSAAKPRRDEEKRLEHLQERRERNESRHSPPSASPPLDHSSKKPRLNDYRERTPRVRPSVPYMPLQEGSKVGLAFVGERAAPATPEHVTNRRQSQVSGDGDETTSELPTTYSLSDLTTQSPRTRLRASQRSTSDPGPSASGSGHGDHTEASLRSSSQPPVRASPTELAKHQTRPRHIDGGKDAASESPDWPRRRATRDVGLPAERRLGARELPHVEDNSLEPTSSPQQPSFLSESALRKERPPILQPAYKGNNPEKATSLPDQPPVAGHVGSKDKQPASSPSSALERLEKSPWTIRPPEPPASSKRFTTHVTEPLRFLAEKSVVKDHFTPVSTSRDLRPLERGYWLIDASSWSWQHQLDFWQFLEHMVGSGNAGWGVWCCREQTSIGGSGFGAVKLYCWGEIVKHVYLMLYVASKSKVRKLGLQWLDAEEAVVVQMRGSDSA